MGLFPVEALNPIVNNLRSVCLMPNVWENSSSHRSSFSLRSSSFSSVNSGTSSPNINGAVVALSPVFPSDGSVGQRDRKLGKRESKHLLQAMHSHLAKAKENMCLAQLRKGLESRGLSYPLTVWPFLLLLRANVPKQHSRDKGALHWKDSCLLLSQTG